MSLGEGYKGGEVRHMEGKLGEYSIMKEPREERLLSIGWTDIFKYKPFSKHGNIIVSKIDMVVATLGLMV